MDAVTQVPAPVNEPVHGYAPGTPERARLEAKLKELAENPDRPADDHRRRAADGRRRALRRRPAAQPRGPCSARTPTPPGRTRRTRSTPRWPPPRPGARCPSTTAPRSSCAPPSCWPARGARRWPPRPCSASRKTAQQAEIDCPCELIDFWRFNVQYARRSARRAAAGQLPGRLEPPRPPPAGGLRLRDHAVQLHRHRGQPADRARADGQRGGVEAVPDADPRRRAADGAAGGGRACPRASSTW